MYKLEAAEEAELNRPLTQFSVGQNGMDGDPKNTEEALSDGGPNRTDPIPGLGGKTNGQIKLQQGQVTLENMDADLFDAVKAGDETHVRARLGGDRKLSDAEAAILVKTQHEEEVRNYELQQQAQAQQSADLHRKEEVEKDVSDFSRYYSYWNQQAAADQQAQDREEIRREEREAFFAKYTDPRGGYRDLEGGYYDVEKGTYTDKDGGEHDNYDGYKFKDGSYRDKYGNFYNAETHTITFNDENHTQKVITDKSGDEVIRAMQNNTAGFGDYDSQLTKKEKEQAIFRDHPEGKGLQEHGANTGLPDWRQPPDHEVGPYNAGNETKVDGLKGALGFSAAGLMTGPGMTAPASSVNSAVTTTVLTASRMLPPQSGGKDDVPRSGTGSSFVKDRTATSTNPSSTSADSHFMGPPAPGTDKSKFSTGTATTDVTTSMDVAVQDVLKAANAGLTTVTADTRSAPKPPGP